MSGQTDLFGAALVPPEPNSRTKRVPTNDMGLIEHVLHVSISQGYVLVGPAEKVYLRGPEKTIESATPTYEADAVHQLIKAGWLKVGGRHIFQFRDREGPGFSVLVPKGTRQKTAQWRALVPLKGPNARRTRKAS